MATKTSRAAAHPARRTKAEVEQEFTQVRSKIEDARKEATPKLDELARRREAEIRQAVEGITVENVVQRISGLGLEVAKAQTGLSEQLTEEVSRLTAVREAVDLEKAELQRLHQLDVAATALDQLVQDYERQKQELEQDIAVKAIEGASGAKTLAHINQIAMEQAKHRSQQG